MEEQGGMDKRHRGVCVGVAGSHSPAHLHPAELTLACKDVSHYYNQFSLPVFIKHDKLHLSVY